MKTFKAKFILFSLLAIIAASFLTSCEQSELVELTEPVGNEVPTLRRDGNMSIATLNNHIAVTSAVSNEAIFATILEASKGKLIQNRGGYIIKLTEDDLGTVVYNAIRNTETLVLGESITISATETAEIFCMDGVDCLVGTYTFPPSKFELNTFINTSDICFELRPGYRVCIA